MNEIVLYGVPLALLVNLIVGIVKFYIPVGDKTAITIKGSMGVICALIVMNLPDIETLLPAMGKYLPQFVSAIVIFASFIGVSGKAEKQTIKFLRKNGLSENRVDRRDQKN